MKLNVIMVSCLVVAVMSLVQFQKDIVTSYNTHQEIGNNDEGIVRLTQFRHRSRAKRFWPFSQQQQVEENAVTEEAPNVVVPTDQFDRNKFVAAKIGGYVRANHNTRAGRIVDLYQARGKQRVVWAVRDSDKWQAALVGAVVDKAFTGADQAGVLLVGYGIDPDAVRACEGAGLWCVLVDPQTANAIRVIYPEKPEVLQPPDLPLTTPVEVTPQDPPVEIQPAPVEEQLPLPEQTQEIN